MQVYIQCIKYMITCLFACITLNGIFDSVFPTNFKGILCIGFLKRAREKKETAKDRVVKDLQVSSFYPDSSITHWGVWMNTNIVSLPFINEKH